MPAVLMDADYVSGAIFGVEATGATGPPNGMRSAIVRDFACGVLFGYFVVLANKKRA